MIIVHFNSENICFTNDTNETNFVFLEQIDSKFVNVSYTTNNLLNSLFFRVLFTPSALKYIQLNNSLIVLPELENDAYSIDTTIKCHNTYVGITHYYNRPSWFCDNKQTKHIANKILLYENSKLLHELIYYNTYLNMCSKFYFDEELLYYVRNDKCCTTTTLCTIHLVTYEHSELYTYTFDFRTDTGFDIMFDTNNIYVTGQNYSNEKHKTTINKITKCVMESHN